MLKSLYIKDYAIIEELNIDFSEGFNVFTGETGAGKSIIVGALSYLTKGKADLSIIRTGAEKTIIEGVFSLEEHMKKMLDEADIDYDDELIVRRTFSRDNRNSIKINQCSVTLSFLNELFEGHIDIHSQKDSQYLLNKKNHLALLDRYAQDEREQTAYKESYRDYSRLVKEYDALLNDTYNERDIEFFRYDLEELESASIDLDEEEELRIKENRYKSAEKYVSSLNEAIEMFYGDGGIKEKLDILERAIALDDDEITGIRTEIEDLSYQLDEKASSLRKILDGYADEDLDIDKIEERLYTYSRLKRKHNTDTEGLLKKKQELADKLSFFDDRDTVLNEKSKQVSQAKEKAEQEAQVLHDIRQEAALKLEKEIITQIGDLMLNNVSFKIKIDEIPIAENGMDDVELFISLNKGEDLKPLRNVASGGEISRLMLALKTVFTSLSETSLVVFDEIDTGVSGITALAIGRKMAKISDQTQVLAITHLAAVAACADEHFYIYKHDNGQSSSTSIRHLNKEEIINELAFISSADNSEASLEAARKLYETAQKGL